MSENKYLSKRKSLMPMVFNVIIIHLVFAFATFFLMYFFTLFLDEYRAQSVAAVLSIILFCIMLYCETWRVASSDRNMMNLGHIKVDTTRGLKAGLIGQIPGLILAILAIIYQYSGFPHYIVLSLYKLYYAPFVDILWFLEQISYFFYLLPLVVAPLVCHMGYILGYRRFSILEKLIYKKKDGTH